MFQQRAQPQPHRPGGAVVDHRHKRNIRLNTELAKKPPGCMEYILLHELIHIIEPFHNDRFVKQMTKAMPDWRSRQEMLNALPVAHEDWGY